MLKFPDICNEIACTQAWTRNENKNRGRLAHCQVGIAVKSFAQVAEDFWRRNYRRALISPEGIEGL
jgi:hypothetical protein